MFVADRVANTERERGDDPLHGRVAQKRLDTTHGQRAQPINRQAGRRVAGLGLAYVAAGVDSFAPEPAFVVERAGVGRAVGRIELEGAGQAIAGQQIVAVVVPGQAQPVRRRITSQFEAGAIRVVGHDADHMAGHGDGLARS